MNKVVYDGITIAGLTRHKFVKSKISLVTTAGENVYTQSIVIYLPVDDLLTPSEDNKNDERVPFKDIVLPSDAE